MPLDRIAQLVRMAVADSDVLSTLRTHPAKLKAPLGLSDAQILALKGGTPDGLQAARSSTAPSPQGKSHAQRRVADQTVAGALAIKPQAKAAVATASTEDPLLPPEGSGQPPNPVIVATPSPMPGPGTTPAPSPASPGSTQPAPASPTSSPAPVIATPSPMQAPTPLGPMPWQPSPAPFGTGPTLSPIPVFRQPAPVPATMIEPTKTQSAPCTQAPNAMSGPILPAEIGSEGCDCCLQITALVGTVTTTSQTAITAITAIAQQRC